MVSINTNLSSLLVQNNLTQSTNGLSKAIERLTTGYKINHASDNAAGYSIAQDMTSKLSSYDVAADNISMGLDLLSVAQNTISQMQTRGERLMALWTQAQNGTFGPTSISAINQEATAIMQEINRLYMNTEYNGIKLFEGGIKLPDWAETVKSEAGTTVDLTPKYNGFIEEAHHIDDAEVNAMTHVSDIDEFIEDETYAITSVDDLVKLASLVNAGKNSTNVTFVMGADIDLSEYCAENTDGSGNGGWNPIGNSSNEFKGTFDGNGHKITNLKINKSDTNNQGLFGAITKSNIKNLGIENANVSGQTNVGILVGSSDMYGSDYTIQNCYATGTVNGTSSVGGLVGYCDSLEIENCYSTANVSGTNTLGGLVGNSWSINLEKSFATGNVIGTGSSVGGLVGYYMGFIENSYATGNVQGKNEVGGLAGATDDGCSNCYATGNVSGENNVGGLFGFALYTVSKSFATGNVSGTEKVGGLVGQSGDSYDFTKISKSYATGNVSGTSQVGGLAGWTFGNTDNSFATGNVEGTDQIGGLIGIISSDGYNGGNKIINNIYASGDASGTTSIGSLIGGMNVKYDGKNGTITLTNALVSKEDNAIGGVFENQTNLVERDMSGWLDNITVFDNAGSSAMTMQVGISGDNSSQIMFETTLDYDLSEVETNGINSVSAYDTISNFLSQLSDKATELGATSNRLESALESTTVAMENITSSLSTIKDADIAKVSSEYIKKQILQQASATLLATANQSPSIALQLL